jgi:hypothetical protein
MKGITAWLTKSAAKPAVRRAIALAAAAALGSIVQSLGLPSELAGAISSGVFGL